MEGARLPLSMLGRGSEGPGMVAHCVPRNKRHSIYSGKQYIENRHDVVDRDFLGFHLLPDFGSMSNALTVNQNPSRFQQAMQAKQSLL